MPTATCSCGTTMGRGDGLPSAWRLAKASTSEAKSVPALARNTSTPRSWRSSSHAWATVSTCKVFWAMSMHTTRGRHGESRGRSPSKEVLPKAKGLPQNRCYHRHRKGGPVTERGRREYAEVMRQRYQRATRQERSALLDEYCRVTRCHRKAAIRRLGAAPVGRGRAPGRPARYGRDLLPVLERVWVASDQLSGKLLRPILPALVTALERHHGVVLAPAVRAALLAASPATLDRLLRPLRRRRPRQPRRLAPAVGSLRAQVPLRTWSEWTGVQPGALQGDLVLHCGESAPGTVTTAASSSMRPCSAGASVRACALRGGARIAKMTKPGSSNAMACWSAASSAMTATAPARRGPPCSASTPCFASTTTSSAPSANS